MFVKMYIYHVNLARLAEYEQIMKSADALYKRYVEYELFYMESIEEPGKFIEIQTYASENLYNDSQKLINNDPESERLYRSFESVLASHNKEVQEETLSD